MSEEFDDLNMYRRKVEKLEQQVGDLGETIGVLKKNRSDLWLGLSNLLYSAEKQVAELEATETLNKISIS